MRGLHPDRFEFRGGRIDNGRNLGRLFGRQIQHVPQMLSHAIAHRAGMRRPEEKMPDMKRGEQAARRCPGREDEQKGDRQLPV